MIKTNNFYFHKLDMFSLYTFCGIECVVNLNYIRILKIIYGISPFSALK